MGKNIKLKRGEMKQYEYLLIGWLKEYDLPFVKWLNLRGLDGWSLVQLYGDPDKNKNVHAVFKRKLNTL